MSESGSNLPAVEPASSADLHDLFRARLEPVAHHAAFASAQGFVSFEQLFASAETLAERFAALGIGPGCVVGLTLPNGVDFVVTLLAAFRCSATVALISSKYRARELQAIQQHLHPDCYVTSGTQDEPLRQELASMGPMRAESVHDKALELCFATDDTATSRADMTGVAVIKLTSGSTGVPKGIALRPAHLVAEARNIVDSLELTAADRILAPVPLAHSYGFDVGLLSMLWSGASLVPRTTFIPRRLLADMAQRETTVFLGVPSIYRTLVDIPVADTPDLSHLRFLLSCTAPLPPALIGSFHDKFGVPICQHYGSSETGAATTHVPSLVRMNPTSVGRAMSGVRLSIVDDAGRHVPPGHEGEVVIAGDAVADGYVMGEPAEESPFRSDGYWSGDLGYLDDAGLLHLTGRRSQIINVGGLKVSPNEVVQVLEDFPQVAEAVVVGVQGVGGGEVVCAVVVLREPTDTAEILAHCRDHLAEYKVPRRIEVRDRLPRSDTGKVKLTLEDLGL
jgi:long-chain acyl-CoA synthetase